MKERRKGGREEKENKREKKRRKEGKKLNKDRITVMHSYSEDKANQDTILIGIWKNEC